MSSTPNSGSGPSATLGVHSVVLPRLTSLHAHNADAINKIRSFLDDRDIYEKRAAADGLTPANWLDCMSPDVLEVLRVRDEGIESAPNDRDRWLRAILSPLKITEYVQLERELKALKMPDESISAYSENHFTALIKGHRWIQMRLEATPRAQGRPYIETKRRVKFFLHGLNPKSLKSEVERTVDKLRDDLKENYEESLEQWRRSPQPPDDVEGAGGSGIQQRARPVKIEVSFSDIRRITLQVIEGLWQTKFRAAQVFNDDPRSQPIATLSNNRQPRPTGFTTDRAPRFQSSLRPPPPRGTSLPPFGRGRDSTPRQPHTSPGPRSSSVPAGGSPTRTQRPLFAGSQRPTDPRGPVKCHRCGELGHISPQCPQLGPPSSNTRSGGAPRPAASNRSVAVQEQHDDDEYESYLRAVDAVEAYEANNASVYFTGAGASMGTVSEQYDDRELGDDGVPQDVSSLDANINFDGFWEDADDGASFTVNVARHDVPQDSTGALGNTSLESFTKYLDGTANVPLEQARSMLAAAALQQLRSQRDKLEQATRERVDDPVLAVDVGGVVAYVLLDSGAQESIISMGALHRLSQRGLNHSSGDIQIRSHGKGEHFRVTGFNGEPSATKGVATVYFRVDTNRVPGADGQHTHMCFGRDFFIVPECPPGLDMLMSYTDVITTGIFSVMSNHMAEEAKRLGVNPLPKLNHKSKSSRRSTAFVRVDNSDGSDDEPPPLAEYSSSSDEDDEPPPLVEDSSSSDDDDLDCDHQDSSNMRTPTRMLKCLLCWKTQMKNPVMMTDLPSL
jgi:hypothetical protein